MLKASMQRVGMMLAITGILALAVPAPGLAAPHRSRPQASLWARVLGWLTGEQGMGIDPDGGHSAPGGLTSLRADQGAGIDPNGKASPPSVAGTSAPSGASRSGDLGAGIDPDGSV